MLCCNIRIDRRLMDATSSYPSGYCFFVACITYCWLRNGLIMNINLSQDWSFNLQIFIEIRIVWVKLVSMEACLCDDPQELFIYWKIFGDYLCEHYWMAVWLEAYLLLLIFFYFVTMRMTFLFDLQIFIAQNALKLVLSNYLVLRVIELIIFEYFYFLIHYLEFLHSVHCSNYLFSKHYEQMKFIICLSKAVLNEEF